MTTSLLHHIPVVAITVRLRHHNVTSLLHHIPMVAITVRLRHHNVTSLLHHIPMVAITLRLRHHNMASPLHQSKKYVTPFIVRVTHVFTCTAMRSRVFGCC